MVSIESIIENVLSDYVEFDFSETDFSLREVEGGLVIALNGVISPFDIEGNDFDEDEDPEIQIMDYIDAEQSAEQEALQKLTDRFKEDLKDLNYKFIDVELG
jgi:hypothetical protein